MTYPFEEGLKISVIYVYYNKNDENKSNLLIKSHKIESFKIYNKAVPYRNLNCQQCYSLNSIGDFNANALIPTNDSILIENNFRSDGQVNYLFILLENKLAGFRANSEIIGKFRKLKKFYGHFVKRQK